MNSNQRFAIERECERLLLRVAKLGDEARWDEMAQLFTPDSELVRPSDAANSIRGREAILASLRSRPAATKRHIITNVYVDVKSENEAHISSMAVRYAGPAASGAGPAPGQEIAIGSFEDDVVLTEAGWAFKRRQGSMALEFKLQTKEK